MTMFARSTIAAALAAGALLAQPASAEMVKYMAELTGAAQVPPVETAATGMADVTIDTEAMTMSWVVTTEGLSGDATAAHVHGPATAEETAPPVIDMSEAIMEGSAPITAEQWQMIQDGMTYVNVHTEANPDGEIRGQLMEGDASTM